MKKLLAILLVSVLICTVLSACNSSENQSEPDSSGSEPQSAQSDTSSEAASDKTDTNDNADTTEQWAPIGTPDEPVKVTYVKKDEFPDEEDIIALLPEIEEKMAAHGQYLDVELLEPPADSYATAMPLAVRSGEMTADIIYFQGGDLAIAQEGLLEDLTPYIESSTYVKAMMDDSNKEKLASYPYLIWLASPRISTPVIRADFVEGLESYDALIADPTTENYYTFFKELVDKGIVEYATTMDGSLDRLNSVFNHAFGVTETIVKEDGKWIYSMASQAEKDKLEYYARLYADGLLDPSYITDTWDVMEQKFYEGNVGFIAGTAGDVIQIYDQKMQSVHGEAAGLVVLPPAKGVSQGYTSVDTTKEPRGFAINIDCENKDAAFALMEFMASPEGRLLDKVGIEGTHYNITDGEIVFTDKFPEWWARFWPTPLNLDPETPLAEPILTPAAQDSIDKVMEYYNADTNILVPNDMAPQFDAMTALYNEYATDIVTGKRDISAFDEFVTKFNEAGGDAFSEYLETVL